MPVSGEVGLSKRRLLVDEVYDRILEAIYSGQLEAGERLNDAELAAWLGVSRTPIRQALQRLESQGVVEVEANRWTRVAQIDVGRFRHAIPVVSRLLRLAALEGTPNLSAADLAELRAHQKEADAALAAGDRVAAVDALTDFSAVFRRASANPALEDALAVILPRLRMAASPHVLEAVSRQSVRRAEQAVITAAAAGNSEAAAEQLAEWFTGVVTAIANHL